jgi:hypothetical protein
MDSREYPSRYLHIAGAFGVGGIFTNLHPKSNVSVQIPTVAPVHLPMVGGTSEARAGETTVDCRHIKAEGLGREDLEKLRERELLSVGSAYSLAQAEPEAAGQPFRSRSVSEVKSVKISPGFHLDYCLLNLYSSHDVAKTTHPEITFGRTEITGLKLGGSELKIELDVDPFNKYPTLDAFETAFQNNAALRTQLSPRFLLDAATGGLHRSRSGYVVGTIVKSVAGLPPGATLEGANTISWPGFGKIILGEILMGPYIRRVTLVRLKHSDTEVGSGCSGGGSLP